MATFALGPLGGQVHVWSVERLCDLARELPVRPVPVESIACLDEVHWFGGLNGFAGRAGVEPTCRRVAEHARRIQAAELDRPIILSATGHVMDGMHRLAKAWILGMETIEAVRFEVDPEPDEVRPLPAVFQEPLPTPAPATQGPTPPADHARYGETMRAYYDHPGNPAFETPARQRASELDAEVAQAGHWRREVVSALRYAFRGRRVLEVACGTGAWTRYVADVADRVLATDASPMMLARARKLARAGKRLPAGRVRFLRLDAYGLGAAPGRFDAALAMNWFEHVPRARHDEFLDALHARLGRGARVIIGMVRLGAGSRSQLFTKPGAPDLYGLRHRPDGSRHEIIDNIFGEEELRRIFAPRARRLRVRSGKAYDWVSYETR